MTTFLLTGVVLFGSFIISSLLLQPLTDLISLRLWQMVPQPALRNTTTEIDHIIGAIITAAVFGLQWRDHPHLAIITALSFYLLLFSGGVARLLLLTRRQMQRVENHQFILERGQIRLSTTDQSSGPVICHLSEQRHPASASNRKAFLTAAIELYTPRTGLVARNTYYDRLQASRMLEQLRQSGQARGFDLALVGQSAQGDFLSVRLSSNWVPLLCGPLKELPPQVKAWWKSLIETDHSLAREINDSRFSHYLHPLYLAAENTGTLQSQFKQEFAGLEQLLKKSSNRLQMIIGDQLRSLVPAEFSPTTAGDDSALLIWRKPQEEE